MLLPVPLTVVPVGIEIELIEGAAAVPDAWVPTVAVPSHALTAADLVIVYVPPRRGLNVYRPLAFVAVERLTASPR